MTSEPPENRDDGSDAAQAGDEILRMRKLRELKSASGTVEFVDNWQELEALELAELELPQ